MKLAKRLRSALFCAAALVATPAISATAPGAYTGLYVFGDSLVDAGNIAVVTGGATPNRSLGYFENRFTNGWDYVDYINYQLFRTPTAPSLKGGNNFSFGGARVVSDTTDTVPDINPQVAAYAARSGAIADPDGLYILNAGGNDLFAIGRFAGGNANALQPFTNINDYINAVVTQYAGAVQTLNNMGARNILITGIPNADVPLALQIEAQLNAKLDTLTLDPETSLMRYSYISFFTRLQTDPASLGLPPLRTDMSCIQLQAQATGCAGIFSFDGTHPTAAVQRALFVDMARQFGITAVPEPASWALMIAGFALAGAALRRRTPTTATA